MPSEAPGQRTHVTATKATTHGAPAVEGNLGGIAAKSTQVAPMVPSLANAALAVQIAIGEQFVIMLVGRHDVATSLLPGGAAVGSPLYIKAADNTLHLAADALSSGVLQAGFTKFGIIESIDSTLGRASVNLSQRGAF